MIFCNCGHLREDHDWLGFCPDCNCGRDIENSDKALTVDIAVSILNPFEATIMRKDCND